MEIEIEINVSVYIYIFLEIYIVFFYYDWQGQAVNQLALDRPSHPGWVIFSCTHESCYGGSFLDELETLNWLGPSRQ